MGMQADTKPERVPRPGQVCRPIGFGLVFCGQNAEGVGQSGCPRSLDDRLAVVSEGGVCQMAVGINQNT